MVAAAGRAIASAGPFSFRVSCEREEPECPHPRPLSLRARGEMALFFIFDPFGSVLGRFVSGVSDLVVLCGPFFCCPFCICTGRKTSGSLFPVFAPSRAVLSRSCYLFGWASCSCSGAEQHPRQQLRSLTKIMLGKGYAELQGATVRAGGLQRTVQPAYGEPFGKLKWSSLDKLRMSGSCWLP